MGQVIGVAGGALAYSAAAGKRIYAFNNLDTNPQEVAPVNPGRQRLVFHNPGDVDILVAPAVVQNTGSDVPLAPSAASRGGAFLVYANGGTLTIEGECQGAWQALAVSSSGKPLTVMDSNT